MLNNLSKLTNVNAIKMATLIAMLNLLALCLNQVAHATTFNVPASYSTIQLGIDAASHNDTVLVDDGFYDEVLDYNGKGVAVISVNGPTVTIIHHPDGLWSWTIAMRDQLADGMELRGFTVTNGADGNVVLMVDGSSPIIQENIFTNIFSPNDSITPITSYWNSGAIVRNNLFANNNGLLCIKAATGSDSIQILNNTFYNNNRSIATLNGGEVRNNIIANSRGYGIYNIDVDINDCNVFFGNNPNWVFGAGTNNIVGNLGFCDQSNNDFGLAASSIAAAANNSCGALLGAFPVQCDSII